jgi:predicted Zn finger-like uncharacterized protein
MLLVCPSCETSFRVDYVALGAEGRNVRGARCLTIWLADPAQLTPEPETSGHEISIFPAGRNHQRARPDYRRHHHGSTAAGAEANPTRTSRPRASPRRRPGENCRGAAAIGNRAPASVWC